MAKAKKQPVRRRQKKACKCSHNHCNTAPGGHRLLSHSAWYEHQRQEREALAARDAATARQLRQQQAGQPVVSSATATGQQSATPTSSRQNACADESANGVDAAGLATQGATPAFSDDAAANDDTSFDHGCDGDYDGDGADDSACPNVEAAGGECPDISRTCSSSSN